MIDHRLKNKINAMSTQFYTELNCLYVLQLPNKKKHCIKGAEIKSKLIVHKGETAQLAAEGFYSIPEKDVGLMDQKVKEKLKPSEKSYFSAKFGNRLAFYLLSITICTR